MLPSLRLSGLSAILVCAVHAGCTGPSNSATPTTTTAVVSNERCPNEPYLQPDGSYAHAGGDTLVVPLAGKIARIPEYHDCQRLLTRELEYGPLVGVWSRDELRSVPAQRYDDPNGVAVAELYNFSPQGYPALGILGAGYSCLYLKREPGSRRLKATMVYLAQTSVCPDRFDPRRVRAKDLDVIVQTRSREAPSAARWDMDPRTNIQYIGIWCPEGWCEVGVPGFTPSYEYNGPREERIKGWYDEQYLSVYDSVQQRLRPSSIRGRTIPAPGLDTLTIAHFTCDSCTATHWRQTAIVIIEKDSAGIYARKLNLEPKIRSHVFLRYNRPQNAWEARIVRTAGTRASVMRRVIRVDHSNIVVPGTSRWHFVQDDETVWMRCSNGCCDVRDF